MSGWGRQRAVTPRTGRGVSLRWGGTPWGQVRWLRLLGHRGRLSLPPEPGAVCAAAVAGAAVPLDVPCHPSEAGGSSPSPPCGDVRCSVRKKPVFKALNMERGCGCLKKALHQPAR